MEEKTYHTAKSQSAERPTWPGKLRWLVWERIHWFQW
jgi:hypothetical protein